MKDHSLKRETQVANKYLEMYSVSLTIGEMKLKLLFYLFIFFNLIPARMAIA